FGGQRSIQLSYGRIFAAARGCWYQSRPQRARLEQPDISLANLRVRALAEGDHRVGATFLRREQRPQLRRVEGIGGVLRIGIGQDRGRGRAVGIGGGSGDRAVRVGLGLELGDGGRVARLGLQGGGGGLVGRAGGVDEGGERRRKRRHKRHGLLRRRTLPVAKQVPRRKGGRGFLRDWMRRAGGRG